MEKMFVNEENDSMASLRGFDLQDLLLYVQSYILEYRESLGLPSEVTFGLELEYENLVKTKVDNSVEKNLCTWNSDIDSTVSSGGEVRSPILYDDVNAWKELKLICNFLKNAGAITMNSAGGHIHVGAHVLGYDRDAWVDFIKLYAAYEHVLFRFFNGDKLKARSSMAEYASPASSLICKSLSEFSNESNLSVIVATLRRYVSGKHCAINFRNVDYRRLDGLKERNTIEFRAPNATVYEVVEQNNVNTITKMILAAKQRVMNIDFLDYKLQNEFHFYRGNEHFYNEICLKDALEFVDLVFDRNIDKVYFLRQYLKDFSSNYNLKGNVEAKRFYKV